MTRDATTTPVVQIAPSTMRSWSRQQREQGRRIGLVPTMGALHQGHLALVDEAHRLADVVVVSIFVNPLQFNRSDDFDSYPRPIDSDLELCAGAGVDAVYAPTAATMYPAGFETHVEPGSLADPLEGAGRPGHFRGVTTVVAKLFGAVQPDVAVFGQKDAQQLAVVRRMVADLDMGIEIAALPTVREADGLAMSSRNRRLGPAARRAATCIVHGLKAADTAWQHGQRDSSSLQAIALGPMEAEPLASIEYVEVVDPDTLTARAADDRPAMIVAAVWFDAVRLIDNWVLAD
jgi:pantoate--beta-alanine ligase